MDRMKHIALFVACGFLLGCATYYQVNWEFNQNFERGNLSVAEQILTRYTKLGKRKAQLLYYLNQGTVNFLLNKPEESNAYFEKAYILSEDYQINYLNEIGAYLINPNLVQYKGEDHELVLLLYYKALNYLKLGDYEGALVECKRANQRLIQLSDKYQSKAKYQRDAFMHNVMGLVYDANKDYNNAFIAYRNALHIYQEDYTERFGVQAPLQLKKDVLRTAYLMGFDQELAQYEKAFGMTYAPAPMQGGALVFFWNNGLAPVKYEFAITFSLIHGENGLVTFTNDEYGFSFPFWLGETDEEKEESSLLGGLSFYRMTIPAYRVRTPLFHEATLATEADEYPLELAENINEIAQYALRQRLALELGKSLLRLAIKKAAEQATREENEDAGALLSLVNALTEQADTRNWQTLPHAIYYTRAHLPSGASQAQLKVGSTEDPDAQIHGFTFDVRPRQTIFHTFSSLESEPLPNAYGY